MIHALLQPWRDAGVLDPVDVHLAEALCRLTGEQRDSVVLAAALAARAPRFGHVAVDLGDGNLGGGNTVLDEVAGSPLVVGPDAPLVLEGSRLYLERYHRYERSVADRLLQLAAAPAPALADELRALADDLAATLLTGEGSDQQRAAVASTLTRRLTVLVGGPGTGKTTTVAAALAALLAAEPATRIALAAPTGKAAARLGEALGEAAARLPSELAGRLRVTGASTVHRLLGMRPGASATSIRYHQRNPLPHDVVIVDETSMVSISLMARLLDALSPSARLVLVGDADQLVSVEAGSVLGDIAAALHHVVRLSTSRRFPAGSSIDRVATAVRAGDADAALDALRAGHPTNDRLHWVPEPGDAPGALDHVLTLASDPLEQMVDAATAGRLDEALGALGHFRLLCAHRHGRFGVAHWNRLLEQRLTASGRRTSGWYPGRPVMITANDPVHELYNGDLGVVIVQPDGALRVAFPTAAGPRLLPPARLQTGDTVHAMTIHKSQGSEFDRVVVVLPPADSPLASRELLYTAITRARHHVTIVGDEAAVRAAVERRVERVGGLRQALTS